MIYTDEQIADLSESSNRLVQANGLYVNQLIVIDIRDAYELAITYRDNRIAVLEAKARREEERGDYFYNESNSKTKKMEDARQRIADLEAALINVGDYLFHNMVFEFRCEGLVRRSQLEAACAVINSALKGED